MYSGGVHLQPGNSQAYDNVAHHDLNAGLSILNAYYQMPHESQIFAELFIVLFIEI